MRVPHKSTQQASTHRSYSYRAIGSPDWAIYCVLSLP
jgi:hypothetical protein